MSCPLHERCTCLITSLPFTAPLTATSSPHLTPHMSNILVGYEWTTPLVTSSAAWYPLEPVMIQPPMSHSGQEISQSECYRLGDAHGALSLYGAYHRESHANEHENKPVPVTRDQFTMQYPQPTPYIQGISRMTMSSNYPAPLVPLLQAHQNASVTASHDELSAMESVINLDQSTTFDEPPPPYPTGGLLVSPLSDLFSQSALLPPECLSSSGTITPSPLAPVPQRHSSLYQVLKQDSQASPAQGTAQSGVSSIAHALEPQELQALRAPPSCTPMLRNTRRTTVCASDSVLSVSELASTSLAVVGADSSSRIPTMAPSVHPPVSSATPPCAAMKAQNGSVVTPSQGHTLAQSLTEATTHDYDTLPRLRKLQPALPGSTKEDKSTASSPLSPLSSRPSSSMGAPVASSRDSKGNLESAFTLPLLGRKRPVLRAKLACLFCRRRKIQCRPSAGDHQENSCQQCAKRSRQCEYPEMTWRGRGRKRSRPELEESDYEEDSPSSLPKSRRVS
ncbi:hypothetical protein F5148DRAFT_472731 [Russula earlei]|uniref:Uncharacterized protein n=1 Tax=Russula earlei TaxID=71964 RepID=A0ACC0UHC5_9AGAM|nr:hypothetical protein F5148DRAFT_472731 [Russula earlei]